MKKIRLLTALALILTMLAGTTALATGSYFVADTDNKIPYGTVVTEGAASVERDADHKDSPYFKAPDYYNMKSGGTLTLLEKFKTQQQTTEWTCGTSAALMVLEYYGLRGDETDMSLVRLRGKDKPGYSSLTHMINIFENLGGFAIESTYDYDDLGDITQEMLLDYLKKGIPVMVEWCDWGAGHWQVVIGYDTMGTETPADDVLILADPYDTSDHWQDGYYTINAERFFYMWENIYEFDDGGKDKLFLAVTPSVDIEDQPVPGAEEPAATQETAETAKPEAPLFGIISGGMGIR